MPVSVCKSYLPKSLFLFHFLECSKNQTACDIQDQKPIGTLIKWCHRQRPCLSSRFDALLQNLLLWCRRVCLSRNFKLHLSTLIRSKVPVSLCFPGTFRGISALHHTSHCRMLQASTSSSQNGNRIFKSEEGLSHRTQQWADRHADSRSWGSDSAELCFAMQMCQPIHSWSHKCRASWCTLRILPSRAGTSAARRLGRSCTFAGLSQHDHSSKSKFTGIKQQKPP